MDQDFIIGLQVTGIGMGLVFLTLILIMVAIILLERAFREHAEPQPVTMAPEVTAMPAEKMAEDLDEVAAIAVAIAAAQHLTGLASGAFTPEPTQMYEGAPGEVVRVIRVEPGPTAWSKQARISALH